MTRTLRRLPGKFTSVLWLELWCARGHLHSLAGSSHRGCPRGYLARFVPSLLILSPRWHWPSGCMAKWSVSEEGRPPRMAFGTNTAAAFPLLYPSVGFGPVLWTAAQIWPGFSKHACTAARPLYTGLFCKYCQQQLNVGMDQNSGLWTAGWLKCEERSFPWHLQSITSIFDIPLQYVASSTPL